MRRLYKYLIIVLCLMTFLVIAFRYLIFISPPTIQDDHILQEHRVQINPHHYQIGNSWIRQHESGIWELYVEGVPYDRGVKIGHLCRELMEYQEGAFVSAIKGMIPSSFQLGWLKYVVAWQNRNLLDYIPKEFQYEIFGISFFLSDKYDEIGSKFQRKLYYHAAHDIGHTVQNMGLVSCSAFSAKGSKTINGDLIIARNFDFYIGEDFARQKVLLFMEPENGIPFVSYSWPGMIGVVSGMNYAGLTVTLNAGPPALPKSAKMPVSILARKILQYADSIEEAIKIAETESIFISELLLIGSGFENRCVVIEKSPQKTVVYESMNDYLICTNHFQTEELKNVSENLKFMQESSTKYRYNRLAHLLNDSLVITEQTATAILRDCHGSNNEDIGIGNEMCINQMITHHSIIFQPAEKEFWISAGSSPMHEYIHYDLDSIFGYPPKRKEYKLADYNQTIPADNWIKDGGMNDYLLCKSIIEDIDKAILKNEQIDDCKIDEMISLNPEWYYVYKMGGQYYSFFGDCNKAITLIDMALTKKIAWKRDKDQLLVLKQQCLK